MDVGEVTGEVVGGMAPGWGVYIGDEAEDWMAEHVIEMYDNVDLSK